MKPKPTILLLLSLIVAPVLSQHLEIVSFDNSGDLTWTNSISDGAYRIEWASSLNSNWKINSPFTAISSTGLVMSAKVPMFYRVVYLGNTFNLSGYTYYSTNKVPNLVIDLYTAYYFNVVTSTVSNAEGFYSFSGISNGTYFVSINGSNSSESFSGGSSPITINNENVVYDLYAAKTLVPVSPPAGSVITDVTPLLQWEDIQGAESYSVLVAAENNLEQVDYRIYGAPATNAHDVTLPLSSGVEYMWIVSVYDINYNAIAVLQSSFSIQ